MAGPFALLAATLFANPDYTDPAVYVAQDGSRQRLVVMARPEDETTALLRTGARRAARVFDILVATVPVRPKNGESLTVTTDGVDVKYRIRSAEPDDMAHVWILDVEPA